MSDSLKRDQAGDLAKTNPKKAHESARGINDPWSRAQALSWVARFTDADPLAILREAAKAAAACDDDYKRSAVRAWEIAALAERGFSKDARKALAESMALARTVQPISSRSESLFLLLQAAFPIGKEAIMAVYDAIEASCPPEHWRSRRARRDAELIVTGQLSPRSFFW